MSTILSPWSDSRAWWVTRVGFLSIPVRPGVLMKPTRVANHAQPSDQNNLCCGRPRVPWPLANLNSGPGCFGGRSIRCLLTPPPGVVP